MHIIRTGSMRSLKLCALFVVSTYISRVINENVYEANDISSCRAYFIFHLNVYFSRKWRKRSQNLEKWKLKNTIYESNDISSCRA